MIVREKNNLKAFSGICPHLGGPLFEGEYCKKSQTIRCPWHGYKFSLKTLKLIENPNEEVWAEKFGEITGKDYKIKEFKCIEESNQLIIQE